MGIAIGFDYDDPRWLERCLVDSIVANLTRSEPPQHARAHVQTASLVELAFAVVVRLGLDGAQRATPQDQPGRCVMLALSTTDYPALLGDVANKVLLASYGNARPAYKVIGAERTFKDFRAHDFVRAGDFPVPLLVAESAEVKQGTTSDHRERTSLYSYSRILAVSNKALANDDLGGFSQLVTDAGMRVADLEDSLVIGTLTSGTSNNGPTLSDAQQLFSSGHGNLAGSGGAIDTTTLGAARAVIANAASPDGTKLNAQGRWLVVPPVKLGAAELAIAQMALAYAGETSSFPGRVTPISDANLTGNAWYLFADPAQLPVVVYGHLLGSSGPSVVARADSVRYDGVQFRVTDFFGCGVIDHRGAFKNPGA